MKIIYWVNEYLTWFFPLFGEDRLYNVLIYLIALYHHLLPRECSVYWESFKFFGEHF